MVYCTHQQQNARGALRTKETGLTTLLATLTMPERIAFTTLHLENNGVTVHLDRVNENYYLEFHESAPPSMDSLAQIEHFGFALDTYDTSLLEHDMETGLTRWHLLSLDETFDED